MDTSYAARLRRLDSASGDVALPFNYDGLMERNAARTARTRRRRRFARAAAGALVVALVGASLWRLEPAESRHEVAGMEDGAQPAAISA